MTDSVQIWSPGFRILDDSGDPIAGGKLKFFDAGTSTPRTVYTDKGLSANAATVITADSSGVPQVSSTDIVCYTNTTDYKVVVTDADDAVVITIDDLAGALDTSNYLTTASPLTMPVQSKTSTYTMVAGDLGSVINCDASGGAFTVTLLAAATAGDGGTITIKKTDSSVNAVTIDGNAAETIDGNTVVLATQEGNSAILVCDGSNWHIASAVGSGQKSHTSATTQTYTTLSTVMPLDDTIPQNTEGDEVLTATITPSSVDAVIVVMFSVFAVTGSNTTIQTGLFKDSTADAIHASTVDGTSGDYRQVNFIHYDAPASTSAITYKVRIGPASGSAYINGSSSARLFGGVASAELILQEV